MKSQGRRKVKDRVVERGTLEDWRSWRGEKLVAEMEFKFNINKVLPRQINKVTHTLVPEDFQGDRREL